jgi:hypothetical protein
MYRIANMASIATASAFLFLATGSDDDKVPAADTPQAEQAASNSEKEAILTDIGRGAGYIYEMLDEAASIYSTLAFDEERFEAAVYQVTNGGKLTPMMELEGTWEVLDNGDLRGRYNASDVEVTWKLSADRTTIVNDKGARFTRVIPGEAGAPTGKQAAGGGPVFGTFALEDASVAVEFTVMGDSWSSTMLIKTGMEAYGAGGEPSYDRGTVVGNDLYDATGNFVIGRIQGDELVTSLGEQRVVLRRR